jgi:hypothetical protein
MNDATDQSSGMTLSQELRRRAELLQKIGNAPASRGPLGPEALSALFKLACSPDTMAEGLKLLHELQTHQIELDLLHEQNEANACEAAAELAHYKTLYEFAPIGYFVLRPDVRVIESNRVGVSLLHTTNTELDNSQFDNFLVPASRSVLSWHLKKLFSGSNNETCTVQISSGKQTEFLQVFASLAPGGQILMLVTRSEQQIKPGER